MVYQGNSYFLVTEYIGGNNDKYLEDHPTDRNWFVTGAIYTWITHELGIILDKVTKWDDPSRLDNNEKTIRIYRDIPSSSLASLWKWPIWFDDLPIKHIQTL